MKVLFISRATLFSVKGGDTVQILNTAAALRKKGITVDIGLCNQQFEYGSYDLVHFFNIIRPADILYHAWKCNKPVVVSPIYQDFYDFELHNTRGFRNFLATRVSKYGMEYLKVLARRFKNGEKIITPSYLWKGHAASIRSVLKRCSVLLPNSESEWKRLKSDFPIAGAYRIIPNAIDPASFQPPAGVKKEDDLVLCAARIDGHKNQLSLIRALNGTRFNLVIAGDSAPNHREYLEECRRQAGPNVQFTGRVSAEELNRLFYRAKVHALPSWFETTGLSCLEAAYCGCNVVMGQKGDQHDYFHNTAWYCDPGSEGSIRENVIKAASAPFDEAFREKIAREYTWEQTAERTWSAYKEVLS